MNKKRKEALEKAGWKIGTAEEFVGLPAIKRPRNWIRCCLDFYKRMFAEKSDIRYEWFGKGNRGKWGICIDESAGGGYIQMRYCPHCGKKL